MIACIITGAVCLGAGIALGVVLGLIVAMEHKRVGHR